MNKRVVRRLLETFFRRWYLYLLPMVLFTGLGAYKASGTTSGFRSIAVVDVSNGTLLSELSSIRGENFGYETPAAATARTINGLLGTGQFTTAVAEKAGVISALQRGQLNFLGLRNAVYATAADNNLLNVVATTANPELSARLARATIDAFVDYVVAGDVAESDAAAEFFQTQLVTDQERLDQAEAALGQYFIDHPGGDIGERAPAERSAIEQLQASVVQARNEVAATEKRIDDALLAREQATHDVQQRLRIVDEPEVAAARQPWLRRAAMSAAVFMFVGLLLTVGAVVLATLLDRSLSSPDDIEHLFRLPVLAMIPVARTTGRGSAVAERAPFTSVASPPERASAAVTTSPAGEVVAAPHTPKPRTTPRTPRSRRTAAQRNEATT